MSENTERTTDGLEILRRRFLADDPAAEARVRQHVANMKVAQRLYELRTGAGLTQQQLAELVGTSRTNIARLESAEYTGHSLSMLRRIAEALGRVVEVRFAPVRKPSSRRHTRRSLRLKRERQPASNSRASSVTTA
jgi:transcriptional regulator with XRE-family HTH domain